MLTAGHGVVHLETRLVAVERGDPNSLTATRLEPVRIGELGRKHATGCEMSRGVPKALDRVEDVGRNDHQ